MLTIALWRAGGIAVCVLLGTIILHLLGRRFVQHNPHPSHAVGRWLHTHVGLALLSGGLVVLVIFLSLARGVGARFNVHLHIRPAPADVRAGAAAPPAFSLAVLMPRVLNQGNSSACGAFAVGEALYAERRLRGEEIRVGAWSPFFDYAYAAGGKDSPTTLDQEAQAYMGHGVIPWETQPARGWPTQEAIAQALGFGGSYGYLFYSPAGEGGLAAIRGEIAHGHPVILLVKVNGDFWNGFGVAKTDNGGAFTGLYHFVVAYAYQGDTFWIRNSWGPDFGQNGTILFTQKAMLQTVLAAGVVLPGPIAWPVPHPEPQPSRVPIAPTAHVQLTPVPHKTAVPSPTPAPHLRAPLVPGAHLPPTIVMVQTQALRREPRTAAARGALVQRGQVLRTLGSQTPSWIAVQTLNRRVRGWILRAHARHL